MNKIQTGITALLIGVGATSCIHPSHDNDVVIVSGIVNSISDTTLTEGIFDKGDSYKILNIQTATGNNIYRIPTPTVYREDRGNTLQLNLKSANWQKGDSINVKLYNCQKEDDIAFDFDIVK
jgi:hypothetical protein